VNLTARVAINGNPQFGGNSCEDIGLARLANTNKMRNFVIERGTLAATPPDLWHAAVVSGKRLGVSLL